MLTALLMIRTITIGVSTKPTPFPSPKFIKTHIQHGLQGSAVGFPLHIALNPYGPPIHDFGHHASIFLFYYIIKPSFRLYL